MIKKLLPVLLAVPMIATAEEPIKWANAYGDYVEHGVLADTDMNESKVIGYEGGYITKNLDVYGFGEYDTTVNSTFTKLTAHYKVFNNITMYAQGTIFTQDDFSEKTSTVGFGYAGVNQDGLILKPYIGGQYSTIREDVVPSIGWSGTYTVTDTILVTHWNETIFDGDLVSNKGDFGIYKDLPMNTYAGIQYRYNYNGHSFNDGLGIRFGIHL